MTSRQAALSLCVVGMIGSLSIGCAARWQYGRGSHGLTTGTIGLVRDDARLQLDNGALSEIDRRAGESIQVLRSLEGRNAEVIAAIDVAESADDQWRGLSDLRAHAARLGADALTDLEVVLPRPGETEAHFCGLAVSFTDVLSDQPFDILGVLDVQDTLLDRAYAELLRQARAMNADYLRNVQFTPPEADGRLRLRAEVIRVQRR